MGNTLALVVYSLSPPPLATVGRALVELPSCFPWSPPRSLPRDGLQRRRRYGKLTVPSHVNIGLVLPCVMCFTGRCLGALLYPFPCGAGPASTTTRRWTSTACIASHVSRFYQTCHIEITCIFPLKTHHGFTFENIFFKQTRSSIYFNLFDHLVTYCMIYVVRAAAIVVILLSSCQSWKRWSSSSSFSSSWMWWSFSSSFSSSWMWWFSCCPS